MDARHGVSLPLEDVVQPLRVDLAAGEDERRPQLFMQQLQQRLPLVLQLHEVEAVADPLGRADRRDVDPHRIVHEVLGDHLDRVGHRRREHHRVALLRQAAEDVAHLREEAEVQHVVGFVEDQLLDVIERDVALPDVIHEAPRRGHDDVGLLLQRIRLRPEAHAADEAGRGQLVIGAEGVEERLRLQGDLACRREDEAAHTLAVGQPFGDGQHEGRRLPRSGLCEADDVLAAERGRDHRRLDGGGIDEADPRNGLEDRLGKAELREGRVGRLYRMLRNGSSEHQRNTLTYTPTLMISTNSPIAISRPRVRPFG